MIAALCSSVVHFEAHGFVRKLTNWHLVCTIHLEPEFPTFSLFEANLFEMNTASEPYAICFCLERY
jgi:hypothetical protein